MDEQRCRRLHPARIAEGGRCAEQSGTYHTRDSARRPTAFVGRHCGSDEVKGYSKHSGAIVVEYRLRTSLPMKAVRERSPLAQS